MALPRSRSALRAQVIKQNRVGQPATAPEPQQKEIMPPVAVDVFAALAHPGRLTVFKALVSAGDEGLPAGKIAELTDIVPQTLSGYLNSLTAAKLATSRREGRRIIYGCNRDFLTQIMLYFVSTCSNGNEDVIAPLVARLTLPV